MNPELSELNATLLSREFGVVQVVAQPSDITFRLPERARVEVAIATTGGDSERLKLHRLWCPPHRSESWYRCNSLVVVVPRDQSITDLEPFIVERLAGRFGFLSSFAPYYAAVVFAEPSGLMALRSRIQSLPRVVEVDLDRPGCAVCGPDWGNQIQSALAGAIPFDRGTPVRGDGIVHYSPGDTVTLRYQNPGGAEMVRTYVAGDSP